MSDFAVDDDTRRIFEITRDFLVQYFDHDEPAATTLVNEFYAKHASRWDDDVYHHHSSFRVAAMVHFYGHLGGMDAEFNAWRKANGLLDTPRDALAYFNSNYFHRVD